MGHLLFDFKWFCLIWPKKKNPINSEVYGVLILFDALKVLEAGVYDFAFIPVIQCLASTLIWSAPELDTFHNILPSMEIQLYYFIPSFSAITRIHEKFILSHFLLAKKHN
jgi:hypothetical protein